MLTLGRDDVRAALDPIECERAVEEILIAHARGLAHAPLRTIMRPPRAAGLMGLMPAHVSADRAGGAFALKAICLMPGNRARGLGSHQGIVALFDAETGVPSAILEASAVTEVRTAAVTAVATRLLARHDAQVLAVIGAGVQAAAHLRALHDVRAWREIRVHAPTAEHARTVAAGYGPALVCADPREAVDGADVVVTATSSRLPVLERDWLAPGAHVNAVGASSPGAMELDVATVAAGALICDSRESLRHEAGEYLRALRDGAIAGEDHVRAELGEALAGLAPGRIDERELTIFRSLGIAVEDLAAASLAVDTARRLGLGTEVTL